MRDNALDLWNFMRNYWYSIDGQFRVTGGQGQWEMVSGRGPDVEYCSLFDRQQVKWTWGNLLTT